MYRPNADNRLNAVVGIKKKREEIILRQSSRAKILLQLALIYAFVFTYTLQAQPEYDWIRLYDNSNVDFFHDVFAIPDGGYAMCGWSRTGINANSMWLVTTNNEGEEILNRTYNNAIHGFMRAHTVIKCDDGGYLMGGYSPNDAVRTAFTVFKTDEDGNLEWWQTYNDNGPTGECFAVIEVKDGGFLAAGGWGSYVVRLDNEGDVIWENQYVGREFQAVRETEGGFVLVGYGGGAGGIVLKIDENGDEVWTHIFDNASLYDMVSCHDGGFAICGTAQRGIYLLRINANGQELWSRIYNFNEERHGYHHSLAEMMDHGFFVVGGPIGNMGHAGIVRYDAAGNFMWSKIDSTHGEIEINDSYMSVVLSTDGYTMVAGTGLNRDLGRGFDGLLLRIVPEFSPPQIVEYSPAALDLSILSGDSIAFSVIATDLQDDSLYYLWTLNGDSVSTDTAKTIVFDEHGDDTVQCLVSDGDLADSVMWVVHVRELYISSYLPDSLEIAINRRDTLNFSIEVIAAEGDPVQYRWNLGEDVVSEVDSFSILFPRSGRFDIVATAFRDEVRETVSWRATVYSAVLEWWPLDLEVSIQPDNTVWFGVVPFNPQSDSLSFYWTRDGDSLSSEAVVEVHFVDERHYEVVAWIWDGAEADSVLWNVNVSFESVGENVEGYLPSDPVLYNPIPNPFNSQAVIMYDLPFTGRVMLNVYDISGRLVKTLVNGSKTSGNHREVLNAVDLSTGIYFVRMTFTDQSFVRKLVVVK